MEPMPMNINGASWGRKLLPGDSDAIRRFSTPVRAQQSPDSRLGIAFPVELVAFPSNLSRLSFSAMALGLTRAAEVIFRGGFNWPSRRAFEIPGSRG